MVVGDVYKGSSDGKIKTALPVLHQDNLAVLSESTSQTHRGSSVEVSLFEIWKGKEGASKQILSKQSYKI
jgi:hypothetical protein